MGPNPVFQTPFSASTALSSFCTSTFAALPLEGANLWEIMQFLSQSESVERSAMDACKNSLEKRGLEKQGLAPSGFRCFENKP